MIARALGGDALPNGAIVPGPGHSARDRSLSITLSPGAPDGFVVHSHAGDDPLTYRDHVRDCLGLPAFRPGLRLTIAPPRRKPPEIDLGTAERSARALAIWHEARDPRATPVESCKPLGVHRTALSLDGRKVEIGGKDRLALGPIGGGPIKLSPDEETTLAIGIGEGVESTLSLRIPEFGATTPVWSLIAKVGVQGFPVLGGVEALWIGVDNDGPGREAAATCSARWREAGREVFRVRPVAEKADLNDLVRAPR
jgi:putative DNA primase/helicase